MKRQVQLTGKGNETLNIEMGGQQLKQANNFVCLGRTISSDERSEMDIKRTIGIAFCFNSKAFRLFPRLRIAYTSYIWCVIKFY